MKYFILFLLFASYTHAMEISAGFDLQAETFTAQSGCAIDDAGTGFSGIGYVDYGSAGSYSEWGDIIVSESGLYRFDVRYASYSDRPCFVSLNGSIVGTLSFTATGDWERWETESILLPLKRGANTLRITAAGPGPNLDKISGSRLPVTSPAFRFATDAESFSAQYSCEVKSDNSGYTGSGYVDYGSAGSYAEWNAIAAPASGLYNLNVRYATLYDRPCSIRVNGIVIGQLECRSTGDWDVWGDEELVVPLHGGMNTIRITAIGSGPNIDELEGTGLNIKSLAALPGFGLEAEDSAARYDCLIASQHSGYSGDGYADFGSAGSYVEWNTVSVPRNGSYGTFVTYATPFDRPCSVSVNGESVGQLYFDSTGDWSSWSAEYIILPLKSGLNTVRITAIGSGPLVDKVEGALWDETAGISSPSLPGFSRQSEDATDQSGCSTNNVNSGYTGRGYVDYGSTGSYIEWNDIEVQEGGAHTLFITYASPFNRSCSLSVNGTLVDQLACTATGDWDEWAAEPVTVNLNKGLNSIRITAIGEGPNIDKIEGFNPAPKSGWLYLERDTETLPTDSDDAYESISLPHTWNARDTLSVAAYRRGASWYRKNIVVSPDMLEQRVYLRFGAAGQRAKVFLNGNSQSLIYHKGGYSAFVCELTDQLTAGTNRVDVWVDNRDIPSMIPQSGDFNFYGGLYRDVDLIVAPEVSIARNCYGGPGVRVWSESISTMSSDLNVRVQVDNGDSGAAGVTVEARLLDASGTQVSSGSANATISAGASVPVTLNMSAVSNPDLWSPEDPTLYTLEVKLLQNGTAIDSITVQHGFRWFEFTADSGFYLNGQPYKLRGANRHQDFYRSGNAVNQQQHYEDLLLMKEAGCNWVRLAHYQQSDEVLRLCDELGLLVWEEIPYVNEGDVIAIKPAMLSMMREMIEQHFNHPSILVWAIGNEVLMSDRGDGYSTIYNLVSDVNALIHAQDPIRKSAFVSGDINQSSDLHIVELVDVFGYNLYRGWYAHAFSSLTARLNELHGMDPGTPLVLTEFGAGSDLNIHSESPVALDFSIEYQNDFMESHLQQIEQPALNWLCGATWWAFADFGSSYRGDSIPHVNQKGVVTFDRQKKDAFYLMKSYWNDEPMVYIESKDWTERFGAAQKTFRIFSNMDSVELFHDGISLGIQYSGYVWTVPLNDGLNTVLATGRSGSIQRSHAISVDFAAPPECTATATAEDGVYVAGNTVDGDPLTSWAAEGNQVLTLDLQQEMPVSGIEINFYNGASRSYDLAILGSANGSSWTALFDGSSSGFSDIETFTFSSIPSIRYLRINALGNSVNDWNSYYETSVLVP
ncbi:MAG: carbohydrate-binding protein [Pontiellaceae bacterium]|nr:carbohydrate-binding protein [Pontiellaceae bacterium]MBN2785931.1 carbohydrate-binding protein [Pontiellaceae bacterium]